MSLHDIQLKQKQLVEDELHKMLDWLHQAEQKRDVASGPTEKGKYELEIGTLKASIDRYKIELQDLEDEIKTESTPVKPSLLVPKSYRAFLDDSLTEEQANFEFQKEVKGLLDLMAYELEDESVSGRGSTTSPTFVAKQEGDFKPLRTLFQCLHGIIDDNVVINFNNIYTLNQKSIGLNFAVIITNTYIAPTAKSLAKQYQIQLLTFEDLLNTIIKIDKYLKEQCRDYEQNNNLFHTYVEVKYLRKGGGKFKDNQATSQEFLVTEAVDGASFEAKGDMTPYVDKWLLRSGTSQLCILGEYGTGKTSFATQYFYKRALAYLENPLKNRLPLLVTLNRYHKSADIEQMMTDFLVNECKIRRDFNTFLRLAARGKLLIILDGFDEMAKQVDVNIRRRNFKEIARLLVGDNKVILSGRPNYFLTQAEISEIFSQDTETIDPYKMAIKKAKSDNHPHYEILTLTLFDRWQIEDFLKKQSEYLKAKGIDDWRELQRTIYDTYNLEELARTPVLLEIIIKTISEIRDKVTHINAAKLYQIYTDFWMDREYDDKGDVRWLITRKEKELFVLELAWAMLMTDNLRPEIHFSQLSDRVRNYFKLEKASEIEYFSSDIRFCAYLIHSEADGNYKFIHKSFMEYFSARYIYQALFEEQNISRIITDRPITDEVFFFLSQMIGSDEIDLLQKFSRETEDPRNRETIVGLTTRILQQSVNIYERRGATQRAEEWANRLMDYSVAVESDSGSLWSFITLGRLKGQLSQYDEAQDYYVKALKISHQLQDRSSESQSLIQIGTTYQKRGAYDEALSYYGRALKIFEELADQVNIGQTLVAIGGICQGRLEYQEALSYYGRALKIFEELADQVNIGQTLMAIGTVYQYRGAYDESLNCYQQALAVFRELGDKRSESEAIFNIGVAYRETGRYVEAERFYKEALAISEEIEDKQGASRALSAIGFTCLETGNYDIAEQYYQQALDISEELGDKQGVATVLSNMGAIYQRTVRYEEAEVFYQRSLSILKILGNHIGIGRNLNNLAHVYSGQGRITEAREYYEQALEIFKRMGDVRGVSSVLHRLGIMLQDNEEFEQARVYYEEALHTIKQTGDVIGTQELLETLGSLEEAQQNYSEAEKLYSSALETALQIGNRRSECELYAKLGNLAKKTGDESKVIDYYTRYIKLAREMNLPLLADIVQELAGLESANKYNPFNVGTLVYDEISFRGREKELELLSQHIQQHNHVMLIAERRMGKSSLLVQLRRTLKPPFIPVSIDLQAFVEQVEAVLLGILREIIEELTKLGLISPKARERLSITYANDFIAALASIIDEAKTYLNDLKIVLIIDEAELLFVKDGRLANVLRAALSENRDIVAIIAGSSRLLDSQDTPASPLINIFTSIFLPPLSKEDTESLVIGLSKQTRVTYEPMALERLYEFSGGVPYYIQLMGYKLTDLARHRSKNMITVRDIDEVAKEVLDARFMYSFTLNLESLDEREIEVLVAITNNSSQEEFPEDSTRRLEIRQIIVKENNKFRFIARLFEEWFKQYAASRI